MAPRGRSRKPRTSRMDAAIDAMAPYGFTEGVVVAKMDELLKEYGGREGYGFIELDAYTVLLDALLADQGKTNQEPVAHEETPKANEVSHLTGFIDILVCSSTPLNVSPPPPPLAAPLPPPPPIASALPPPTILDTAACPPLQNAQPRRGKPCYGWISDDDDNKTPLPPPPPPIPATLPPPPALEAAALPPPENAQPQRRKPCYGWISDDDDENSHFITLPSSLNRRISPPETRPTQPLQPELSGPRRNKPKRRSRWDVRPEDM